MSEVCTLDNKPCPMESHYCHKENKKFDTLDHKEIEKSIPKPKCAFPKCSEVAITTYHGIPLCQKHAEWAEFIRWFYYKLGL